MFGHRHGDVTQNYENIFVSDRKFVKICLINQPFMVSVHRTHKSLLLWNQDAERNAS